jgi:hypothetical protein
MMNVRILGPAKYAHIVLSLGHAVPVCGNCVRSSGHAALGCGVVVTVALETAGIPTSPAWLTGCPRTAPPLGCSPHGLVGRPPALPHDLVFGNAGLGRRGGETRTERVTAEQLGNEGGGVGPALEHPDAAAGKALDRNSPVAQVAERALRLRTPTSSMMPTNRATATDSPGDEVVVHLGDRVGERTGRRRAHERAVEGADSLMPVNSSSTKIASQELVVSTSCHAWWRPALGGRRQRPDQRG